METNNFKGVDIKATLEFIKTQHKNAVQLEQMEMYDNVLINARRSLEKIAKDFCAFLNIPLTDDLGNNKDLATIMDNLINTNEFNQEEIAICNNIRYLGNRGAHGDPTAKEAHEGISLLEKLIEIYEKRVSQFVNYENNYNEPMKNPDYYSNTRKYYGAWCNCYTRNDLLTNRDYVYLEERSLKNNDIDAMLDIASGFLPKKINWNDNGLICMPAFYYRGQEFSNPNAFDARYYYWVNKACKTAVQNAMDNKPYSKKYIATAFLEMIKFLYFCMDEQRLYVKNVISTYDRNTNSYIYNKEYGDQYDLVKYMFGENIFQDTCIWYYIYFLAGLLYNYDSSIISKIHRENNFFIIQYIYYCFLYLFQNDQDIYVNEDLAILKEHVNKKVDYEFLKNIAHREEAFNGYNTFPCKIYFEIIRKVEKKTKLNKLIEKYMKSDLISSLYVPIFGGFSAWRNIFRNNFFKDFDVPQKKVKKYFLLDILVSITWFILIVLIITNL